MKTRMGFLAGATAVPRTRPPPCAKYYWSLYRNVICSFLAFFAGVSCSTPPTPTCDSPIMSIDAGSVGADAAPFKCSDYCGSLPSTLGLALCVFVDETHFKCQVFCE